MAIFSDLGKGGVGVGGGGVGGGEATDLQCFWGSRWGSAEEDELRNLKTVGNVRETSGRGMVISEILYWFLLRKFPLFLAPFYFSPLCG